jgi:hypothetical protein
MRLDGLDQSVDARGVQQITIMQYQPGINVGALVREMGKA